MEPKAVAKAKIKYIRVTPRKMRVVTDLIRGRMVDEALSTLAFTHRRATRFLKKLLESAIANAKTKPNVDVDNLYVARALVEQGPTLRRFLPRAMGRATRVLKKTCHVQLELAELV